MCPWLGRFGDYSSRLSTLNELSHLILSKVGGDPDIQMDVTLFFLGADFN